MTRRYGFGPWITAVAATVASASASAQPTTSAPCTARPTASFHLRPRAVDASIGTRLPARTELVMLDETRYFTRGLSALRRVRVASTGATGYAFVSGREYASSCVEPVLHPLPTPPTDVFSEAVVRRGAVSTPEAGLVAGWTAVRGAAVDVDLDGQQDLLVSASREGRYASLVALRRGRAWELQVLMGPDQEPCEWQPSIASGRDVWLSMRCRSQGESGYSEATWLLHRFDPRSRTVRLAAMLTGDRLLGGIDAPHPHRWRFEAPAPNTLRVTGDRGAPLVLRFDAARWTCE